MAKYRCNHCKTVFESEGVRDCCLPAAVAEQARLRRKLVKAQTEVLTKLNKGEQILSRDYIRDLFGGMG